MEHLDMSLGLVETKLELKAELILDFWSTDGYKLNAKRIMHECWMCK